MPRCPNGTRRNKKTNNCEPHNKTKRSPIINNVKLKFSVKFVISPLNEESTSTFKTAPRKLKTEIKQFIVDNFYRDLADILFPYCNINTKTVLKFKTNDEDITISSNIDVTPKNNKSKQEIISEFRYGIKALDKSYYQYPFLSKGEKFIILSTSLSQIS